LSICKISLPITNNTLSILKLLVLLSIPLTKLLTYIIIDISQFDIEYDFNGIDHSIVLEISTLNSLPQETGISSTNNLLIKSKSLTIC
jgi:hypothetical protein